MGLIKSYKYFLFFLLMMTSNSEKLSDLIKLKPTSNFGRNYRRGKNNLIDWDVCVDDDDEDPETLDSVGFNDWNEKYIDMDKVKKYPKEDYESIKKNIKNNKKKEVCKPVTSMNLDPNNLINIAYLFKK
jgi:hypothetical protein